MAHRQSNATHTFHDILEAAHLDLSTPSCYSEQLFLNFIFILLFFFFFATNKTLPRLFPYFNTPTAQIFEHARSKTINMDLDVAVITLLLPLVSGGSQKPMEKKESNV